MEARYNKFVTFKLTEEEEAAGSIFHPLQLAVLHNRRAEIATEMLTSLGQHDPQNPEKNRLHQAELTGQMIFADWVIALAEMYKAKAEAAELERAQAIKTHVNQNS